MNPGLPQLTPSVDQDDFEMEPNTCLLSTGISGADEPNAPSDRLGAAGRRFETIALLAILLLTLAFRLKGLEQNGWGAEYYTAAVRSMALNWNNFFYWTFDPTGFIYVDKPPIALWLQLASGPACSPFLRDHTRVRRGQPHKQHG